MSASSDSRIPLTMDKYQCLGKLGEGAAGTVWKAMNRDTGDIVAIKAIKRSVGSWEQCMELPEFKCQRNLTNHPNVVGLQEVHRESNQLFFVFDYMEKGTLYSALLKQRRFRLPPFGEDQIRTWCYHLLTGLNHVHQSGYIHLDIKPENLLLSSDNQLKIADFGLAADIGVSRKQQPLGYVATRWYRAPELLLRSAGYVAGPASDIWAAGIIMTELYNLLPIFRGTSEDDQIGQMCEILGEPTAATWDEGVRLLKVHRGNTVDTSGRRPKQRYFGDSVPRAGLDAIDLIRWMLSWDPKKRPTAAQALDHPFFRLKKKNNRRNASSCRRFVAPRAQQQQTVAVC